MSYDYTQTPSAAHAAGSPRAFPMPGQTRGTPVGEDGYVHELPFLDGDDMADMTALTRVMNGAANLVALHCVRGGAALRPLPSNGLELLRLVDADGDTYRGLVLRLPEFFWREDRPRMQVLVDLPGFQTRDGEPTVLGVPKTYAEAVDVEVALGQMLAHARAIGMGKNPDFPQHPCPLTEDEVPVLVQAACELADAYQHYYAYSEGHGKSYEGAVSLVVDPAAYLGAPRQPEQPDQPGHSVIGQIHLASYVFARHGRSEDFASVDELAAFARQTHQTELAESYYYDEDEDED